MFALHTPILIIEMSTRLIYLFTYLYKQRTTSWQELGYSRGLNYQGNSSFVSFVVVLYTQNRVATNLVQHYYTSTTVVVVVEEVEVVVGGRGEGGNIKLCMPIEMEHGLGQIIR